MVQQQTGRNQWDGELGAKEREDFLTLPEWHRKMFLNFPCPLDTTNIERIRKSLSAVNNGNDEVI
ncbi:hypothetical protein [Thiothrix subterranea]|uniref:Uncharacterized protein n=1 Tax=Thiothrix subterranea TaxID=2735563 RepID=A0AA51R3Q6_9GAMM|nr:hypothetical protein [Thiothrix subterranea]MDQ5770249.1 hypothetical protein [Thiothrix subterranea]WML85790.1 hypothetical protein RCG00_15975 [Thiothrix subterranea]